MKPSELLSALCLIIVVLFPLSLMFIAFLSQIRRNENQTNQMLRLEVVRNQTFLNLLTSPNFQTFAGMQTYTQGILSQNQQSPSAAPTPSTISSDYVPKDDISEAVQLQKLSQTFGVGEQLFLDDPETAEMLAGMMRNGQIDFGEGG